MTESKRGFERFGQMSGSRGSKRRAQSWDAPQCFYELGRVGVAGRESQRWHTAGTHRLGRNQKQALPQALQRRALQVRRSTQPLEPVQQVVAKQNDLKETLVGGEVFRGNFSQRVGVLQFADDQLGASPLIVKAPQVQGLQRKVGDQHLVAVIAHLEKMQLCRGFFRHGPTDHHEASRPRPPLRTIAELRSPHSRGDAAVPQSAQPRLQRASESGDDGVKSVFLLDKFDDFVIEESPSARTRTSRMASGNLPKARVNNGIVIVETCVSPGW